MPNKPGPKGPHGKPRIVHGTLRQKAWQAMQIKGRFTLSDLVRVAPPEGSAFRDARGNIRRYVRALTTVGILVEFKCRVAPTTPTSNGEKRWLLVRDLGMQAPIMRSAQVVFDPNAGQMIAAPVIEAGAEHGQ